MMRHFARVYCTLMLYALLLSLNLFPAPALPDEAAGRVVSVISGDALGIEMLIGDNRTAAIDSIKLADIEAPSTVTEEGKAAKEHAYSLLMNRTVYLDIDDNTTTGRNEWSQLICVIYLMDGDLRPVWPPVNRLLVDAAQARVSNDTSNEFDPATWWQDPPSLPAGVARKKLLAIQQEQKQASQAALTVAGQAAPSGLSMGEAQKSSILDTSTSGRISIGYRK